MLAITCLLSYTCQWPISSILEFDWRPQKISHIQVRVVFFFRVLVVVVDLVVKTRKQVLTNFCSRVHFVGMGIDVKDPKALASFIGFPGSGKIFFRIFKRSIKPNADRSLRFFLPIFHSRFQSSMMRKDNFIDFATVIGVKS